MLISIKIRMGQPAGSKKLNNTVRFAVFAALCKYDNSQMNIA